MAVITLVSENISKTGKDETRNPLVNTDDYKYQFKVYDDDGIFYIGGYCNDEDMEDIYDYLQRDLGVTRLDTRLNGSDDDYDATIG